MYVTQSTKKVLMFLLIILFVFLSFGFSEKLAVMQELNRPSFIQIDGHKLYVLDNVEVKTYSMKDYRFLGKFGKLGNGPGELVPNDEIPLQMQVVDGEVFLNSQTKWIRFSTSGQVIKEKATHFMGMQIIPLKLGRTYVISKTGFDESAQIFFSVILYNKNLKELKIIYTSKESPTFRGTGKIFMPPNYTYMYCAGNRLFVTSGRQEKFHIKVFDLDGNPLKAITLDYKRPKWTDSLKNEVMDWLAKLPRLRGIPEVREVLKQKLVFPEYMPAIRNVVAADSKVYVQTYKKKNNLSEFLIFDFNGKLLKTVFLPVTSGYKVKLNPDIPFTIKNNKYYYLVEDENDGEWELHVSKIE